MRHRKEVGNREGVARKRKELCKYKGVKEVGNSSQTDLALCSLSRLCVFTKITALVPFNRATQQQHKPRLTSKHSRNNASHS